ncbi:MAG: response regulator [Pseudomonadales bacterium]
MNTARILLVEDEPYARREITKLIDGCEDLSMYAVASNLAEGRQRLFDDYDLLVADKQLPDGSGIDLIRELNQRPHNKRTLMMTVFEDERTVLEAIEAGVDGYLVKNDPYIVDALCAVMCDGNPMSPSIVKYFLARLRHNLACPVALNGRELDTLQALAGGSKYHEIAAQLQVSKHTVPDYIKSLYRKLGVNDRSSAVYVGIQQGLITLGEARESASQAEFSGR